MTSKKPATNFVPQSEASIKASNEAFKRFTVRLTELHKERAERDAKQQSNRNKVKP